MGCHTKPPRAAVKVDASGGESEASGLFPETQTVYDLFVPIPVRGFEVLQQLPSLANHLQETPAGMVVLFVDLEMVGKHVDPLRQKSYLDRSGSGIRPVDAKTCNNLIFIFFN